MIAGFVVALAFYFALIGRAGVELIQDGRVVTVALGIGVLILRKTQPDAPRTFRVPFAPVICTLGVLSCLFLLIFGENWYNWTMMGVWTILGFFIYFG